jgi:hypothetical protein
MTAALTVRLNNESTPGFACKSSLRAAKPPRTKDKAKLPHPMTANKTGGFHPRHGALTIDILFTRPRTRAALRYERDQ